MRVRDYSFPGYLHREITACTATDLQITEGELFQTVSIFFDGRSTHKDGLRWIEDMLREWADFFTTKGKNGMLSDKLPGSEPPVEQTDEGINEAIRQSCREQGVECQDITVMAGEDLQIYQRGTMIMVRARGTHTLEEYVAPEDLAIGTKVMLETIWRRANR